MSEDASQPEDRPERQLRFALQALAMSAEVQLSLFPEFVCRADELALDFGDAIRLPLGDLTGQQASALRAIEIEIAARSRGGARFTAEFWTDGALRSSPDWVLLRRLGAAALTAFGWPVAEPPRDPGSRGVAYVQ
jgi:hypothetical protein